MEAWHIDRHVDFKTEGNTRIQPARYLLDTLDVIQAINHHRYLLPTCKRPRDSADIAFVPGRIADEQIIQTLRCKVGRLLRRITHDALKTSIGQQNPVDDRQASQRFGCESYAFSSSPI